MHRYFLRLLTLVFLTGCEADPSARNFAAPQLGTVTIEAEAFQAKFICPVEGSMTGVAKYGFRFGKSDLSEIPATLSNGQLSATVKRLDADTHYQVEAYLNNGSTTLSTGIVAFQTEAGPETVEIPDPVFRRYVLSHFDENHDDILSVPEALLITEITVCTDSIYSMKGIEKMSWLKRLTAEGTQWGHGILPEIDLSGNPLLEYCHLESNRLHKVDLSGNPLLNNFSANVNPLDSIDFSHNLELTEIGMNNTNLRYLPEMTHLPLVSLHMADVARFMPRDYFKHFPEMRSFNIGSFQGKTLVLTLNPNLHDIWCCNAPYIEELDLTASTQTTIGNLHIQNCPKLRRVLVRTGVTIQTLEKDKHTEIVYVY